MYTKMPLEGGGVLSFVVIKLLLEISSEKGPLKTYNIYRVRSNCYCALMHEMHNSL